MTLGDLLLLMAVGAVVLALTVAFFRFCLGQLPKTQENLKNSQTLGEFIVHLILWLALRAVWLIWAVFVILTALQAADQLSRFIDRHR